MDPFSVISGLFSTGANLWMNNQNNELQEYLAGQQMRFQHNEAEISRKWQEQMQDKMNAYNSPQAQMQRMVEAGLNPYLLSGSQLVGEATAANPPSGAQAGSTTLPNTHPGYIDPLTASQINLNDSLAAKHRSETEYQNYMNEIERQLSHLPVGSVHTIDDNGNESYEVTYGNARVLIASNELKALGLSVNGLQYQLSDLFYDLAVKCGSLDFTDNATFNPTEQPNFALDSAAYRGDANVRKLASDMAQIGYEAAQAEKAGRQAYAKWLDEHKDEPIVKFALTLQGFFQSTGISLPSISKRESGYYSGGQFHATSRQWFFGK